jgi:hypothetical protein
MLALEKKAEAGISSNAKESISPASPKDLAKEDEKPLTL